MIPEELFGHAEFPRITEQPYVVTLGPHDFYWFLLKPGKSADLASTEKTLPVHRRGLDRRRSPWTGPDAAGRPGLIPARSTLVCGEGTRHKSCRIVDAVDVAEAFIILLQVDYKEGSAETYVIPLAAAGGRRATDIPQQDTTNAIARLKSKSDEAFLLYEAVWNRDFGRSILRMIGGKKQARGSDGGSGRPHCEGRQTASRCGRSRTGAPSPQDQQSNTSILDGEKFFLKLFRRVDSGVSLDYEINKFLTERTDYPNVPALVGALEYRGSRGEPSTLAILQRYVPSTGDSWRYTLDSLGLYFENVVSRTDSERELLMFLANRSSSWQLPRCRPRVWTCSAPTLCRRR